MAQENLLLKVSIDTDTESNSDIVNLILELINTTNDNGLHVMDVSIGDELVFNNKGFQGRLRKNSR